MAAPAPQHAAAAATAATLRFLRKISADANPDRVLHQLSALVRSPNQATTVDDQTLLSVARACERWCALSQLQPAQMQTACAALAKIRLSRSTGGSGGHSSTPEQAALDAFFLSVKRQIFKKTSGFPSYALCNILNALARLGYVGGGRATNSAKQADIHKTPSVAAPSGEEPLPQEVVWGAGVGGESAARTGTTIDCGEAKVRGPKITDLLQERDPANPAEGPRERDPANPAVFATAISDRELLERIAACIKFEELCVTDVACLVYAFARILHEDEDARRVSSCGLLGDTDGDHDSDLAVFARQQKQQQYHRAVRKVFSRCAEHLLRKRPPVSLESAVCCNKVKRFPW